MTEVDELRSCGQLIVSLGTASREGFYNVYRILKGGQEVGYFSIEITTDVYPEFSMDEEVACTLYLRYITIDPRFRRQGLFRYGIRFIEGFARDNGFQGVFLQVHMSPEDLSFGRLVKTYERLGYRHWDNNDPNNWYMVKRFKKHGPRI